MSEQKNSYDLAILGSGPGGYVAALYAAQSGLKTALIEEDKIGGTCLNRGCIPTKSLLHAGEVLDTIEKAKQLGITVSAVDYDMEALYSHRDATVNTLRSGIQSLLKHHGVTVIRATGRLVARNNIECVSGDSRKLITAGDIIVATGSRPAIPPIPGLEEAGYWTSDTLLETSQPLPGSMTIIGGGVIGVECATILNDLGVQVSIIEMMPQLLPRMDAEIAKVLEKSLKKSGIAVYTGASVRSVSVSGQVKQCTVDLEKGTEQISSQELFVAIGRSARTEDSGIEQVGIAMDGKFVAVDADCRTNIPHHYAIGDILGGWMLAHAASAQGLRAVDAVCGRVSHTAAEVIPACVYTRPEIGSVGLTAIEAGEQGYDVQEGYFPMSANSKAVIAGEKTGFVKIISDTKTGAVLGAHMIGARATDIISEMALAIASEITVDEIAATVHPHPTVSESLMEASHDILGHVIHTVPRRKKR